MKCSRLLTRNLHARRKRRHLHPWQVETLPLRLYQRGEGKTWALLGHGRMRWDDGATVIGPLLHHAKHVISLDVPPLSRAALLRLCLPEPEPSKFVPFHHQGKTRQRW